MLCGGARSEANDPGFYPTVVRTPSPGTDDTVGLVLGATGSAESSNSLATVSAGGTAAVLA